LLRLRAQLSIQTISIVITAVNSLALDCMIVISSQSLWQGWDHSAADCVFVALTLLLALLFVLLFLIIESRVVRPLAGRSYQVPRIEAGDEFELLSVSGDDELFKLVHGFAMVLVGMRIA
jgi:signal transduction histidine kinase